MFSIALSTTKHEQPSYLSLAARSCFIGNGRDWASRGTM